MILQIKVLFFSIFVFLAVPNFVSAQSEQDSIQLFPQYIYWDAGSLLKFPSSIHFGYERFFGKRFYWDVGAGLLLFKDNPNYFDFDALNKRGARFKTGIKTFTKNNFFFGVNFMYKAVRMQEQEWLERYDGILEEKLLLDRNRNSYSLLLEGGWHLPITNTPMSVDFSYGFGFTGLHVNYPNMPDDAEFGRRQQIANQPGLNYFPLFDYSLKLKYALGANDQTSKGAKDSDDRKKKSKKKSKKRKKGKKRR